MDKTSPSVIERYIEYLESQFEPIMDYNFTANVEKEFDPHVVQSRYGIVGLAVGNGGFYVKD